MLDRGEILQQRAEILLSHLPEHIALRERDVIARNLGIADENIHIKHETSSIGPGNVVMVFIKSEHITEVFSGFGERGVPAEKVAEQVIEKVKHYLRYGVPIGKYLADQLLVPLALAGSGQFLTLRPSTHATTNMAVIEKFMNVTFHSEEIQTNIWKISVKKC